MEDEINFLKKIIRITEPELLAVTEPEAFPRDVLNLVNILANLYDKGYIDSISDLQNLR